MQIDYAIIGTGPSAVAAAAALIDAGLKPTFIDAGSLTSGKIVVAQNRSQIENVTRSPGLKKNPGQKAWFGSFDTYSQKYNRKIRFQGSLNVRPSNAIGGFSRIWGATFEFWPEDSRWPTNSRLEDVDYQKIATLVSHAQIDFNHLAKSQCNLPAATASQKIFRRLKLQKSKTDFEIVPATLAIETRGTGACVLCSACLEGCPEDSIWFAGAQVQKWLDLGLAKIRDGLFVTRIKTGEQANKIDCVDKDGKATQLEAKKIYIAAGAIGTAEIILNSSKLEEITIKDTNTIFTAGISFHRQPQLEARISLSQFWVKWLGPVQMGAQFYAPSINNVKRLTSRFQFLSLFEKLLSPLVLRMHPIIIYLDEQKSPTIEMKKSDGGIAVTAGLNFQYKKMRKTALKKVRATGLLAGLFIPPIGTDFAPAGTGYHFGASLPMGQRTDRLGRLKNWDDVYLVDSSVLPYLAVGSITPTMMANAHRIARQSLEEDK